MLAILSLAKALSPPPTTTPAPRGTQVPRPAVLRVSGARWFVPGGCGGREGGGARPARGRPNGGPGHGAAAGGGGGAGRVRGVPQVGGRGEPRQSPAAEERGPGRLWRPRRLELGRAVITPCLAVVWSGARGELPAARPVPGLQRALKLPRGCANPTAWARLLTASAAINTDSLR